MGRLGGFTGADLAAVDFLVPFLANFAVARRAIRSGILRCLGPGKHTWAYDPYS